MTILAAALHAATIFNIITFAGRVLELLGLSIGGVMSAAAVGVVLGDEEALVFENVARIPGFGHLGQHDLLT